MNFKTYQAKANALNIVAKEFKLFHAVLAVGGEAGEIMEKFKKLYRDKRGILDEEFITDMSKELGDVLWGIADLATQLGLNLDDIATQNIDKLESRRKRKMLQGSGDNR